MLIFLTNNLYIMKILGKLNINPKRVIKEDELRKLQGGTICRIYTSSMVLLQEFTCPGDVSTCCDIGQGYVAESYGPGLILDCF
jgi:hypothetical protein